MCSSDSSCCPKTRLQQDLLAIRQLEALSVGEFQMFSQPRSSQYVEMDVFRLLLVSLAGWMNRQQQDVIDYLQVEIRVLKEMAEKRGGKRLRFTDDQRARLARKAKRIRFGRLKETWFQLPKCNAIKAREFSGPTMGFRAVSLWFRTARIRGECMQIDSEFSGRLGEPATSARDRRMR